MRLSENKLRRILRRTIKEAIDDHPYVEQAEVEDVLLECFLDWVVRSPTDGRQGGDLFGDFVEAVARKLGMPVPDLKDALQNMMFR